MSSCRLILASRSPRRRELFKLLGIPFDTVEPEVQEAIGLDCPELVVQELALGKARPFRDQGIVVAADTIVVIENRILGKPRDIDEAYEMLRLLRGRMHSVLTGVAVVAPGREVFSCCTTRVAMREYSEDEIKAYISSGKALDKAGAYGIQDADFAPVASFGGCYLNVVGLPICTLGKLLREVGLNLKKFDRPQQCRECPIADFPDGDR